MRKFCTQFDEHPRYQCCTGSRIKKLYAPRFDENGVMDLVEKGEENLYEYIQSHKDSVDINTLLRRYAQGDPDALSRVQAAYGDFTGLPSTYADLLNAVNDGKQYFESLPVDVRAQFNHSFSEFMASMDGPDFWRKLGVVKDEAPAPEPVKEEKSE
nr:MAG: internal scaffolding protein [Microvirus sp.]